MEGNQAFSFIAAQTFTGAAGELRSWSNATTTFVAGDVDGDGAADFAIVLNGVVTLAATDFAL